MDKKILIIGISVILLIVGLSGCTETTQSDTKRMVGAWTNSEMVGENLRTVTYIFLSDKTCEISATYEGDSVTASGTWRIVDDKLVIDFTSPSAITQTGDFVFSNDYNTLTITDSIGSTITLTKQ